MYSAVCEKRQEARTAELQAEADRLQQQLGRNVDAEKIVKEHIKLLHEYNEAKDAAQVLIGRLAGLREMTVREVHESLGLLDIE
ncbi:SWI5/SAE3 family protein [Pleurotus pulmonarius]